MGIYSTGNNHSIMTMLYVGNLPWATNEEGLLPFLQKYGTVVSCDCGELRNGRMRGWAIMQMGTAEEVSLHGGNPLPLAAHLTMRHRPGCVCYSRSQWH